MEWNKVNTALERLVVDNGCLNEAEVTEVKMVGLHKLKTVTIETNCFVPPSFRKDSIRGHFCLKDCEQLKELKIGSYSFLRYCVFEIEKAFSLEEIDLGDNCFCYTSLELKSMFL